MPTKAKTISIPVHNLKGDVVAQLKAPAAVLQTSLVPSLLSQAVRVFTFNQAKNQTVVKTRAQVKGSTRKIYRQKGTGQARHGDLKAPIFVGGGKAHGSKGWLTRLKLTKKMKAKVLSMVLSHLHSERKITVIKNWPSFDKTRQLLDKTAVFIADQSNPKLLLVYHPDDKTNLWRLGRNVPYLSIKSTLDISFMDLLKANRLIISQTAFQTLINRGGRYGS
ncbi:MAG: 50S ribosomal protein L4 [bacterium]|nr:50S ribosomal protein L4 [bacterium]